MTDHTILVGDAGGTNVRFALARVSGGKVTLSDVWKRPGAEYPTFAEALAAYCAEANPKLTGASFGLAGQVQDGRVELLNRGWTVGLAETREQLKLSHIVVVNDFFAMARAAPEIETQELSPGRVAPGRAAPDGSLAVGGPGTGFGMAVLRRYSGKTSGWIVVGGEGGHQTYAPQTDLEWKLAEHLRAQLGDVSNEIVAAGAGFEPSLDAVHAIMGVRQRSLTPGQTMDMAKAGDPVCLEFCRVRAACVMTAMGNLVLLSNATGGAYIAGGVGVRLEPWLREKAALDRFYNRGPRTELLRPIPIRLIKDESVPLIGSAKLWLDERERGWL